MALSRRQEEEFDRCLQKFWEAELLESQVLRHLAVYLIQNHECEVHGDEKQCEEKERTWNRIAELGWRLKNVRDECSRCIRDLFFRR